MYIKKLLFFTTVIVLSLSITGCGSFRSELFARDDKKIADTRFQEITEALENKDKEALKKLFSPNALKEAKEIDGSIDYIMNFYKEKLKSMKGTQSGSGSNDHGKKTSELNGFYRVTTDNDKYIIFFVDNIKDTENVGLYMLQIIKESDREKYFDGGGDKTRCAGIFIPSDNNVVN